MSTNKISKANDTLVFETECTFCTQLVKVDTKMYGLPQTRERRYMFVWRPKDDDINDDLGQYWAQIVKYLESPAKHAITAFMLEDDHPDVRRYREALNGPPGRQSRRQTFQEPDFFASSSGDVKYNLNTRKVYGIDRNARFLTNWNAFGQKQVAPKMWLPWINCKESRIVDFLDILYASSVRDAECHDPLFSSFSWNISQNAGRESHRTATPGIAGCLTPGGDFFVPHRGRPLLGSERLLAQGIPYFRLMLGNETNVQLGDLAGNAMSLTVVCATILAAITCDQLRLEASAKKKPDAILKASTKECAAMQPAFMIAGTSSMSSAFPFLRLLAQISEKAVQSSVLCVCESTGNITESFVQCDTCRVTCCRSCISDHAGLNLSSHKLSDMDITKSDHNPTAFQEKLRELSPTSLCFAEASFKELISVDKDAYRVATLPGIVFNLHRIKRDCRRWLLLYYARDNHGIGEAIAEIRISVGEIKTQSLNPSRKVAIGAMAELTSFLPALTAPVVFGKMEPCAKIVALKDELPSASCWTIKASDAVAPVTIDGSGVTASLRVEVGLSDDVAKQLQCATMASQNKKHFARAKERGEARRWVYAKNWKEWPELISIRGKDGDACVQSIAGSYRRASCRHTTNQSALWVRDTAPALFIIIRPNVNRTGLDSAVISSSIDHSDSSAIVAMFPRDWQPCDALTGTTKIELQFASWKPSAPVDLSVVDANVSVESPHDSADILARVSGLSADQVSLLSGGTAPSGRKDRIKLQVDGGQNAQQIIRAFNSACVSPILALTAKSGLKYSVDAGTPFIAIDGNEAFGLCDEVVPFRPTEEWVENEERGCMERTCQPGAAREHVLKLQRAKKPFEFFLECKSGVLEINCYPAVAAHHAAAHLLRGRSVDGLVKVAFKMADASQQLDPECKPFVVHNCNSELETDVKLEHPYALYQRQQKVVTKILAIENECVSFEEVELSEFEMPGSTGFSLMAKASRTARIRGGVIADAIGAGKTVVSIALIVQGLERAKKSKAGPRKTGASLVVVPPGLIDQWESEIAKFAKSLSVVKIYDFKSLERTSAGDILQADVVICPIDILESKGYFESLIGKSGLEIAQDHVPTLPAYSGQAEITAANGVWIPHTSQDPYNGGNNPRSQRRRDDSAFYTYIYSRAIDAIRELKFASKHEGVPLEYFEWERVIVDEIHESLCTTKVEMEKSKATAGKSPVFKERNRRAGRELLGVTTKDISKRPLVFRGAMLGLTGTPLLDAATRVTELANLMGGTYVTGLSSHWRRLEKESGRDIFLSSYLEPKQSREVRKMIDERCQEYLNVACCRNKAEEEMEGIQLAERRRTIKMSNEEKALYIASQTGIEESKRSLSISTKDFDVSRGAEVSNLLQQNAMLASRSKQLVSICDEILADDPHTKIIVFADASIGAVEAAANSLTKEGAGIGCTCLQPDDSVQEMNRKISYYQHADATEEDKQRPRVLVLSFENAAGLNLQTESFNVVLFHPLYSGNGGTSDDPVQDVSVELQAIGRVFRNGQTKSKVYVHRIEVVGPNGEACLDTQLLLRNTDKETIAMATNADD